MDDNQQRKNPWSTIDTDENNPLRQQLNCIKEEKIQAYEQRAEMIRETPLSDVSPAVLFAICSRFPQDRKAPGNLKHCCPELSTLKIAMVRSAQIYELTRQGVSKEDIRPILQEALQDEEAQGDERKTLTYKLYIHDVMSDERMNEVLKTGWETIRAAKNHQDNDIVKYVVELEKSMLYWIERYEQSSNAMKAHNR